MRLSWNGWGESDDSDRAAAARRRPRLPGLGARGARRAGGPEAEASEALWTWLAGDLGLGALLVTPSIAFESLSVPDSRIDGRTWSALAAVAGKDRLTVDPVERVSAARGRGYDDLLALRAGEVEPVPDAVFRPKNVLMLIEFLELADRHHLAVRPLGGGSAPTGAPSMSARPPFAATVAVDMRLMGRLLTVDPVAQTAIAEAGIGLHTLEEALNAKGATLGPLPPESRHASLGGWIASGGPAVSGGTGLPGAGPALLSVKLATPKGPWTTECFPASSAGPDLTRLALGSEGAFGIVTEATLRVRPLAREAKDLAYFFRATTLALEAVRALSQAGLPGLEASLYDGEEARFWQGFATAAAGPGLRAKAGAAISRQWRRVKNLPERPALLRLRISGTPGAVDLTASRIAKILEPTRPVPAPRAAAAAIDAAEARWFERRDAFLDHGLGLARFDTATRWSNVPDLVREVTAVLARAAAADPPAPEARAHVLTKIGPVYGDGAALRFTLVFARRPDRERAQWQAIAKAGWEAILEQGGTLAHGDGIGAAKAPWLVEEKGPIGLAVLKAVKREVDPNGILSPGRFLI